MLTLHIIKQQYVIIAGSRTITDYSILLTAIEAAKSQGYIDKNRQMVIISGGARGVDTLASRYASENKLDLREYKPQYRGAYDKGAPLRRNPDMAAAGDVLIAIWDGVSTGTGHMISCMESLGKPVYKHIVQN